MSVPPGHVRGDRVWLPAPDGAPKKSFASVGGNWSQAGFLLFHTFLPPSAVGFIGAGPGLCRLECSHSFICSSCLHTPVVGILGCGLVPCLWGPREEHNKGPAQEPPSGRCWNQVAEPGHGCCSHSSGLCGAGQFPSLFPAAPPVKGCC